MGDTGLLSWCVRCLGVGGSSHSLPLHPVTSAKIHRTMSSSRGQDSDETEEEEEEEEESYVHRRQPGSATPLLHPPGVPLTVAIHVQPRAVLLHHPDLQSTCQWPPSPSDQAHQDSLALSSPRPASPPSSPTTITSHSNSPTSSTRGSQHSLHSLHSLCSQHNHSSTLPPADKFSTGHSLHQVEGETPKRRIRFMTPEEGVRPPQETCPPRLVEYPQSGKSGWVRGGGMLRSLFGFEDSVRYVGQYMLHGGSKPVKLRSHATLQAISSFHSRMETSSTPVWYSFGKLVLALRYRAIEHMLDVEVTQVTQLPPGKENIRVDLKVSVTPGKREKWVKGVSAGSRQAEDTHAPSCSLKLCKVSEQCLVVSAYLPGVHSHPYLALGHGIIANLGAQQLSGKWQACTLQLRQGQQVQDHLGTALVALSCCERERGCLTFTVDVLHLKKMKVLRLGNKVASSFKTKVSVCVVAVVLTEGSRARKEELSGTTLEQPRDSSEKGWEGIFKNSCSTTFSVPISKVEASCVVLEMHGRACHVMTSNDAMLGKVILGPEELFGGKDHGRPLLGAPQTATTVPGDPIDARLTHWGLAIRRRAKIEMWHRLQI